MKHIITLIIIITSLFSNCSNAQNKPPSHTKNSNIKKVLVIGASGSLAKYLIDTLLNVPGFHLTLLARNKNRIENDTTNCTVIEADVMDYVKLKNTVAGKNIIYVNLAGDL